MTFVLFSFSVIFLKKASGYPLLSNEFVWFCGLGMMVMAVYALLWQQVLKRFSLTVAFSNKVIMYFWVILWSVIFFKEPVTAANLLGLLIITVGIITVSKDA
jgi:drug/metabolite transporter (DMT)-like permease